MAKKRSSQKRAWWKVSWEKILLLFFLGLFIAFSPGQNVYLTKRIPTLTLEARWPFPSKPPAPYPVNVTGFIPSSELTATGIVVLDVDSGVYLFKKNEELRLGPASTTKIVTALVALETYDLDDIVTVAEPANDGQVMGLVPGERITVENLLFGALVHSGNDAAWALAAHYPGGVAEFVRAMNQKAGELHLTNTSFTNPVGYDDPAQYVTPLDLSRLAAVALATPEIAKMVAIPQITISDVTHTYFHPLKNVNELLGKIPGVGGIKTGWTEEAGENLITLVERNGKRVIIVVLHSADRFADTSILIDWVYNNFQWKDLEPR